MGYSNAAYLSFGLHAYSSYYAYAYYGDESGRHDCWDQDLECLEDARKRNRDTGILVGLLVGIPLLFISCCVLYCCCLRNLCIKRNVPTP